MPTLTVNPNPIAPGEYVNVNGSGFSAKSKVQLTLDGVGSTSNIFRPQRDGSFKVSLRVSTSSKTQTIRALVNNVVVASTPVVVSTVTPTPTPTPTPSVGIYGPGVAIDSKANLVIGPEIISHRFVASTTSTITSMRWSQRGGPEYSGGTGGWIDISLYSDAGGFPGTRMGGTKYTPGNPSGHWTTYLAHTIPDAHVTKGYTYHIVFRNLDSSPSNNWISVNEVFSYAELSPRVPSMGDAYACLRSDDGNSWWVDKYHYPVMDILYADGTHDGLAYVEAMIAQSQEITGQKKVRQTFVPEVDTLVSQAAVRVRRKYGQSPLSINLNGVTLNYPSSLIEVGAFDNFGTKFYWQVVNFPQPIMLKAGVQSTLTLSTAADTVYTMTPIRDGIEYGLKSKAYREGIGQYTIDGTNWLPFYQWGPYACDIQCYLK